MTVPVCVTEHGIMSEWKNLKNYLTSLNVHNISVVSIILMLLFKNLS